MGMDVYGKNPKSEKGECFSNSIWFWHPLAQYIEDYAPEFTLNCENWHTNDGDGLDEADSVKLADWLDKQIASGHVAGYATRPQPEWFYFDEDNVKEFAAFLRVSGGFEIC